MKSEHEDSQRHVEFYCQWPELFARGMNWINFDFIKFDIEYGGYKGNYVEINLSLVGFCIRLNFWGRQSRAVWLADMDQRMAEAKTRLQLMGDDDVVDDDNE